MAKDRHHLVLGAGITGLSCAYALMKQGESVSILEMEEAPGGWCKTLEHNGLLIEEGPRTFAGPRTPSLLALIEKIGLRQEILPAMPNARRRFLWDGSSMMAVPPKVHQWWKHPLLRKVLVEIMMEWRRKPEEIQEESFYAFMGRRFGPAMQQLSIAIAQGIWAADPQTLDAKSCLARLVAAEKEFGSLTKALWHKIKNGLGSRASSRVKPEQASLWSLRRGIGSLITALQHELGARLMCGQQVVKVNDDDQEWQVVTRSTHQKSSPTFTLQASHLWVTLPTQALQKIEGPWNRDFPIQQAQSLRLIHCIWKRPEILPAGFGYLCLKPDQEPLLGAVYDSSCFPSWTPGHSKATLMQGGSFQSHLLKDAGGRERALQAFCRHARVPFPDEVIMGQAYEAIPHYSLGAQKRILEWVSSIQNLPPIHFLGASWGGVAVEDCVESAFRLSKEGGGCARAAAVPGYILKTSIGAEPDPAEPGGIDIASQPLIYNKTPC